MNARRLTKIALLAAMAIILHIAEGMIPVPMPIPGVKLGFANIITLTALALTGFGDALTVVVLRTVLGSLFGGTFLSISFYMSFSGSMTAALIMALLLKLAAKSADSSFSLIGISLTGALTHNLTQLLVASVLMSTSGIFYYLPVMLLSSIPTGILIGILAKLLIPRLKNVLK